MQHSKRRNESAQCDKFLVASSSKVEAPSCESTGLCCVGDNVDRACIFLKIQLISYVPLYVFSICAPVHFFN